MLLEGQLVYLPKTHYPKDKTFNLDTPIFATGKGPIAFSRSGIVDERETDMMAVSWNVFTFHAQIRRSKKICYLVEDALPSLFWGKMKAIGSETNLFYNLPPVTTSNHNNTMKIM